MSSTKVNSRVDFGKIKHLADVPDLLEVQVQSFKEFFQLETTPDKRNIEGLFRVFKENFPITDTRNIFVLEFLDYFIDPPRYTIEECMERGLTYAVPLKAKLRLSCNDEEHVDFQTIVQDVFLGNIPYMTPRGTFVINGAERVVVSGSSYLWPRLACRQKLAVLDGGFVGRGLCGSFTSFCHHELYDVSAQDRPTSSPRSRASPASS